MSYWLTDSVRRRNRGSLRSTGQKHRIVVSVCVTSAEAAAAARHRLYAEDENTDEYRSILHSRSLFRAARRGVSFPCMQVHCHSLYEVVVVGHAAATAAMYDMQAHNKNQLHTLVCVPLVYSTTYLLRLQEAQHQIVQASGTHCRRMYHLAWWWWLCAPPPA